MRCNRAVSPSWAIVAALLLLAASTAAPAPAAAPNDLYAGSAGGVLRSRDGGATWESTPSIPPAWGPYRQRILRVWAHPTERGHVFAAPSDGGLFENRLSE